MFRQRLRALAAMLVAAALLCGATAAPAARYLRASADAYVSGSYITEYAVNLREAPSADGGFIITVPKNTVLAVTEIVEDTSGENPEWFWGKTNYSNGAESFAGYVCLYYCARQSAPVGSDFAEGYYRVAVSSLNMREGPSTSDAALTSIPEGKIIGVSDVTVDNTGKHWGKTTYTYYTAYVCLDFCEKYTLPGLPSDSLDGPDRVNWKIVDISQYQPENSIDWEEMKAGGIDGVIMRVGGRYYGDTRAIYSDSAFYSHYINARAAGMHIGVYFFSFAMDRAGGVEEAKYTLDLLDRYDISLDMPIFIDIEEADGRYDHEQIGKAGCTEVVDGFCKTVEDAGRYAGVYCNLYFANNLIDPSAFRDRAVWLAQWSEKCSYEGRYDIWQYTNSARIDGYTGGYVDMNECYVNFPKLISDPHGHEQEQEEEPPVIQEPEPTQDGSYWKIVEYATCSSDGLMEKYLNGELVESLVIQQKHTNVTQCVLFNSSLEITVGEKLDPDLFRANFVTSASGYFDLLLKDIRANGGCIYRYCLDCGEILEAVRISSSGCAHELTETSTQPTCTAEGSEKTVCAVCGLVTKEAALTKLGHDETEAELNWQTDKPYTVTGCSRCGKELHRTVLKNGDVDYSGDVTVTDARTVLRIAVALEPEQPYQIKLADTDADGRLTVTDARTVLRKAIGLE